MALRKEANRTDRRQAQREPPHQDLSTLRISRCVCSESQSGTMGAVSLPGSEALRREVQHPAILHESVLNSSLPTRRPRRLGGLTTFLRVDDEGLAEGRAPDAHP